MAPFIEELWLSVFTPGPTPVLVVATNATFSITLPLLIYLAIYNSSFHYAFLSVICACLWASINWFVREVRIVQAQQEKEAAEAKQGSPETTQEKEKVSDQETEAEVETSAHLQRKQESRPPREKYSEDDESAPAPVAEGRSSLVEPVEQQGELKARVPPSSARSGVSTEDEWEKVSEEDEPHKGL